MRFTRESSSTHQATCYVGLFPAATEAGLEEKTAPALDIGEAVHDTNKVAGYGFLLDIDSSNLNSSSRCLIVYAVKIEFWYSSTNNRRSKKGTSLFWPEQRHGRGNPNFCTAALEKRDHKHCEKSSSKEDDQIENR